VNRIKISTENKEEKDLGYEKDTLKVKFLEFLIGMSSVQDKV